MSKQSKIRSWCTTVCACLLSLSCAPSLNGNDPKEANVAVPESFSSSATGQPKTQKTELSAQKKWSEMFSDPELRSLIEASLANNQELNIQMQEIIIANTEVSAKKGEYMPRLDAGVGVGLEKVGDRTSQGVSDEAHDVPKNLANFKFGLSASWEIDIWKKLRNATAAAKNRYLASIEGRKFLVTQLVAEIANSYYELIALDNRLEVLERNIAIQSDALEVVKLQKIAARVTQLAVQRFEAEVLKNRSLKYDLEQQRIQAENQINFLVGRFPQPVKRNPDKFKEPVKDVVETGFPSQLLENRPDVKQAELQLEAAKLDVKSTKAGFYPALSIEAGVGYESFNAVHLLDTPQSLLYNLAGNLTAPLLNRAAIKAQYRTANAIQVQAVFNYERAILRAFTDVANGLAMIENLKKSYDLESQQVKLLTDSIEVSNVLFQSARADYMEVLLTRRDSLDAEMDLIETKLKQMQATVGIYQSLGGGWN
jgi:outer membrane protein, multidrug efflux system